MQSWYATNFFNICRISFKLPVAFVAVALLFKTHTGSKSMRKEPFIRFDQVLTQSDSL